MPRGTKFTAEQIIGKLRLEEGPPRVSDGDIGKHVAAASLNPLGLDELALSELTALTASQTPRLLASHP